MNTKLSNICYMTWCTKIKDLNIGQYDIFVLIYIDMYVCLFVYYLFLLAGSNSLKFSARNSE